MNKVIVKVNKKDSNGLFSGRFKNQVFKGKKEKLKKLQEKEFRVLLNNLS